MYSGWDKVSHGLNWSISIRKGLSFIQKRKSHNVQLLCGMSMAREASVCLLTFWWESITYWVISFLKYLPFAYFIIFTNPSARAGYDTRSIFKGSLIGLNSEFSFSKTSCLTKAEGSSRENKWIHTFPKGISAMWNAIILVQDLNSCCCVHSLRR